MGLKEFLFNIIFIISVILPIIIYQFFDNEIASKFEFYKNSYPLIKIMIIGILIGIIVSIILLFLLEYRKKEDNFEIWDN